MFESLLTHVHNSIFTVLVLFSREIRGFIILGRVVGEASSIALAISVQARFEEDYFDFPRSPDPIVALLEMCF